MSPLRPALAVLASSALAVAWAPLAHAVDITSSTETTPWPGVRVLEGRTANPATNFSAALISLCTDDIHVDASAYVGLRTSASWAGTVGVELAVNGDFYTLAGTDHVYGDAAGGGARWPADRTGRDAAYAADWYYGLYGWIAFGDAMVEYSNTEYVKLNDLSDTGWRPDSVTTAIPAGTRALVSGFPQLVIDGAPVTCASPTASSCFPERSDMRARHPRTAMGLDRDRTTFILLVVDGRSTASVGMYGTELADLVEQLGAHTAFNLDGGGSSQMWVRGRGTINDPSDGTPRSVLNHWGIYAGGGNGLPRLPGSCDLDHDGVINQPASLVPPGPLDLNGDGRGDVCARTLDGFRCALAAGAGFGTAFAGPAFTADNGWNDPDNYATIRYGDLDGDGLTDLCARANAGLRCYPSTGAGFGPRFDAALLTNAEGFTRDSLYTTFRLADVTGDGRADACARHTDGFRCFASTGNGFGPALEGPALSDANGWADPSNYGTIRMGDVTGDGRADVCARANAGVHCWPSTGAGFGARFDGPALSDAEGWAEYRYWRTLRLADLDGDGLDDLCARGPEGVSCYLATGAGFGPALAGPALSDAAGWGDPSNFETLRLADVTGDGRLDLCARANAGLRCWPFDGTRFGTALTGPMDDAGGWDHVRYYRTLQFSDIDGDGDADVCARAARGLVCWRSTGAGFETTTVDGPLWTDATGFDSAAYYSTVHATGPIRPPPPEPPTPDPEPDVGPPLDAGTPDVGAPDLGLDAGLDAGASDVDDTGANDLDPDDPAERDPTVETEIDAPDPFDTATPSDTSDGVSEVAAESAGGEVGLVAGCGCSSTSRGSPTVLLALGLLLFRGRAARPGPSGSSTGSAPRRAAGCRGAPRRPLLVEDGE